MPLEQTKTAKTSTALLLLLGLLIAVPASATPIETANEYLDAYRAFDVDSMVSFYEADSVFTDPTSEIFGDDAYTMVGKDQIVKRFREFLGMYDSIKLDIRVAHTFESAGHVVFMGNSKATFTKSGEVTTMCGRITTIVTLREDKVIEHRDYFDYATAKKTLKKGDQQCA